MRGKIQLFVLVTQCLIVAQTMAQTTNTASESIQAGTL